jgi:hypothetical protein
MGISIESLFAAVLEYGEDECFVPSILVSRRQREALLEVIMKDNPRPEGYRKGQLCKTPGCFNRKHLYWKRKTMP